MVATRPGPGIGPPCLPPRPVPPTPRKLLPRLKCVFACSLVSCCPAARQDSSGHTCAHGLRPGGATSATRSDIFLFSVPGRESRFGIKRKECRESESAFYLDDCPWLVVSSATWSFQPWFGNLPLGAFGIGSAFSLGGVRVPLSRAFPSKMDGVARVLQESIPVAADTSSETLAGDASMVASRQYTGWGCSVRSGCGTVVGAVSCAEPWA